MKTFKEYLEIIQEAKPEGHVAEKYKPTSDYFEYTSTNKLIALDENALKERLKTANVKTFPSKIIIKTKKLKEFRQILKNVEAELKDNEEAQKIKEMINKSKSTEIKQTEIPIYGLNNYQEGSYVLIEFGRGKTNIEFKGSKRLNKNNPEQPLFNRYDPALYS